MPQSIFKRSLCASILVIYVCFAVFGLGLHHWSGLHSHTHSPDRDPDSHTHCAVEHSCCHDEISTSRSQSDSKPSGQNRYTSDRHACQWCQQWWSVAQSSQVLKAVESICLEVACGLTILEPCSLSSGNLVAWNSRAPPVL
ncbi:MAG: hypothetical protein ACKOAU_05190 [Pirellula sp.]